VYAFIEEEESSKEEKARGQDWQIADFTFAFHSGLRCEYTMLLTRVNCLKKESFRRRRQIAVSSIFLFRFRRRRYIKDKTTV